MVQAGAAEPAGKEASPSAEAVSPSAEAAAPTKPPSEKALKKKLAKKKKLPTDPESSNLFQTV